MFLHAGTGEIEKANLQRFYCTFLDSNCEEAKQAVIDAIYDSLTSVSCPRHGYCTMRTYTRFMTHHNIITVPIKKHLRVIRETP